MMVYPAPGRRVRDPHTKALLPETGRDVPDHDFYWLRRLRDGDVTQEATDVAFSAPPTVTEA